MQTVNNECSNTGVTVFVPYSLRPATPMAMATVTPLGLALELGLGLGQGSRTRLLNVVLLLLPGAPQISRLLISLALGLGVRLRVS